MDDLPFKIVDVIQRFHGTIHYQGYDGPLCHGMETCIIIEGILGASREGFDSTENIINQPSPPRRELIGTRNISKINCKNCLEIMDNLLQKAIYGE